MWSSTDELKLSNKILIPKYLKMPKPQVKYSREKISKEFFSNRINEITHLIQSRRDVKLFLTFCIWLQANKPKNINELNRSVNNFEKESKKACIKDLKYFLDLVDEKLNVQQLPMDILEFFDSGDTRVKDPGTSYFVQVNKQIAKLTIQIVLNLEKPIDPAWDFIEEIFPIPRPSITQPKKLNDSLDPWVIGRFEILDKYSQEMIKLIYNMFEYFSNEFSGIHEHFLRMATTLFWCTRPESVYSLEMYGLLTEMFGEHKLNTRSSQLCDKCNCNELITCEKKIGSKNRSSIYFMLSPGAEWIIVNFFPDNRDLIQQQAVAISFLRYSKQILTCPWTINPMNFNYLMDIWFKSFLYSDNLDQIVYEKARELRREIIF